jgi:tetratricopeptide (TPR) repeat protein
VFNWAPVYGDIAQAGDLGWNTGPTVIEDASPEKKPTRHGMFFSVWKKQTDGGWRVALDLGADTPAAVAPLNAPYKSSYRASSKKPAVNVNVEEEIAGGSYELGGAKPQKGYFARVWKRDSEGQWRIVMDTITTLPPGTPHLAAQSQEGLASKAQAHYLAQQWAEAAAAYQQYIKQNPNDPVAWHRLGTSQIYLRQLPEAIKSLEQAIKVGGGAALDFYNLACAFALSGQKEKALDNLEKAIKAGFTDRQQYESDSDLDSLRETERFKELLKRLR